MRIEAASKSAVPPPPPTDEEYIDAAEEDNQREEELIKRIEMQVNAPSAYSYQTTPFQVFVPNLLRTFSEYCFVRMKYNAQKQELEKVRALRLYRRQQRGPNLEDLINQAAFAVPAATKKPAPQVE